MLSIEEMRESILVFCLEQVKNSSCSKCPLNQFNKCSRNLNNYEIARNYQVLFGENEEENNKDKHLNGYIFDSLMYRYQLARERQLMWEITKEGIEPKTARDRFNRDLMRFGQILDEAIGEHD